MTCEAVVFTDAERKTNWTVEVPALIWTLLALVPLGCGIFVLLSYITLTIDNCNRVRANLALLLFFVQH